MQRKFITNLGLLIFLNLLVKPFWIFGIDREVYNQVGTVDYGMYSVVLNFTFLFSIFLDLGLTNFNTRHIARNEEHLNRNFSSLMPMKFLLGVMYFVIIFLSALIIGYEGRQLRILGWLGLNQFLMSLILYLRSNISGLLLFRTDSVLSVLDRLLMIGICGFLMWSRWTSSSFKIEWFVYAQTASYFLTAVIALGIVTRRASFRRLRWDRAYSLTVIRESLPFALLVLLMYFQNRIDSVMIERILPGKTGDLQAGIYSAAFRLLDAATMFSYLFSVLLLPIFSRMISRNEPVNNILNLAYTLLMILALVTSIGSWFYSDELNRLLYRSHIEESSQVFRVLMFSFVPISTTYVFGTLLTANGNLRELNLVAASGMVLAILLNAFLIPRYQAYGSAWASLISQSLTAAAQVILAIRLFHLRDHLKIFIKLMGFIILVVIVNLLARELSLHWVARFCIMSVLSLLAALLLKLLRPLQLMDIFRNQQ